MNYKWQRMLRQTCVIKTTSEKHGMLFLHICLLQQAPMRDDMMRDGSFPQEAKVYLHSSLKREASRLILPEQKRRETVQQIKSWDQELQCLTQFDKQ